MSVQKLLAEADRLLDKGKVPEAIEKLKSVVASDPTNQLNVTKLANVYLAVGDTPKAVALYEALAKKLSDNGKNLVAVAVYKQALEIDPGNVALREKYTFECEQGGKLGDAYQNGQQILQHYLARKKYFDALNIMPLLARVQPKDEETKKKWLELLYLAPAETKLIHALVAFCGPPGIVSQEFSVGGDPVNMSQETYGLLARLVGWFPKDPRLPYALAWVAFKQNRQGDFLKYLREAIRREPDFTMAYLLFARWLSEQKKLNETLYVYKLAKERMPSDKTVDMLTINKQMEAFLEKNGWISFSDASGDSEDLSAAKFVENFKGAKKEVPAAPAQEESKADEGSQTSSEPPPAAETEAAAPNEIDLSAPAPGEIELSPAAGKEAEAGLEIQFTGGQTRIIEGDAKEQSAEAKPAIKTETKPEKNDAPAGATASEEKETVDFTSLLNLSVTDDKKTQPAPEAPPPEARPQGAKPAPVEAPPSSSGGFNPFDGMNAASAPGNDKSAQVASETEGEKTQVFSPMDILAASNLFRENRPAAAPSPPTTPPAQQAPAVEPAASASAAVSESGTASDLYTEGEKTVILSRPAAGEEPPPASAVEAPPSASLDAPSVSAGTSPTQVMKSSSNLALEILGIKPSGEESAEQAEQEEKPAEAGVPAIKFTPIPEQAADAAAEAPMEAAVPAEAGVLGSAGPDVDLGDDLLEGPTRMLNLGKPETTHQLLKDAKADLESTKEEKISECDLLLKRAERYLAKRNYYFARKSLRHALALGADENVVKEKLRQIRALEIPNSMYATVSSDSGTDESIEDILERLESEFDLEDAEVNSLSEQVKKTIREQIDALAESGEDPQTLKDLGVGFYEMGMYEMAEGAFNILIGKYPEESFDAHYLMALAKGARRDFAGAVGILKVLCADKTKTEEDKMPVYYSLGEFLEKMSQSELSRSYFEKVAAVDAGYRNVQEKLGHKDG